MERAKMTKEDKKWRAQCDARTLADAEAIKTDKARLKLAQMKAKEMAKEAEVKAKAMKKIAKPAKKRATRKKK